MFMELSVWFKMCVPKELRLNDRLRAGRPGFDSHQVQEIYLLSTAFRQAVRPTQPLICCVPLDFSWVKWPRLEADH
jgi:hypothetical protein